MVVRSERFFTVFTTGEEADALAELFAKAFHEELEVPLYEGTSGWKMSRIISKSKEARVCM